MRPVFLFSLGGLLVVALLGTWVARQRKLAVAAERQSLAWQKKALGVERERDENAARLGGWLERSQADTSERESLTVELQGLRRQLNTLEQVAADNRRLQEEIALIKSSQPSVATGEGTDLPLARSGPPPRPASPTETRADNVLPREKLEAWICFNHLYQIQLAAAQFAMQHDGRAPTSFFDLKGLIAPMILVCPAAFPKSGAFHWQKFDPDTITYRMQRIPEMWFPRFPDTRTKPVGHRFVICPIHRAEAWNFLNDVSYPSALVH